MNTPDVTDPPKAPATSTPASGSGYAILLLDTLAIKRFGNKDDLMLAVAAKGRERCIILKYNHGAGMWTTPETYA